MPPVFKRFYFAFICLFMLGIASGNSQSVYSSITKISRANDAIKRAKLLSDEGKHKEAYASYAYAIDSLGLTSEAALLNKGQAAIKSGYETEAKRIFNSVSSSENRAYRSTAFNQLGVLTNDAGEAISYFKEALKANPNNEAALKNYELAYRKLKKEGKNPERQANPKPPQPKQDSDKQKEQNKDKPGGSKPQDQQNSPQESNKPKAKDSEKEGKENKPQESQANKSPQQPDKGPDEKDNKSESSKPGAEKEPKPQDESNKPQQDKKGNLGEKKSLGDDEDIAEKSKSPKVSVNKQKLAEMNLTEEQAKNLLDAMKASEVQYLQQMKRGTKKRSSRGGKQDW